MLFGHSAGGFGVTLNCDHVAENIHKDNPDVDVRLEVKQGQTVHWSETVETDRQHKEKKCIRKPRSSNALIHDESDLFSDI